jgi:hypothetical protein
MKLLASTFIVSLMALPVYAQEWEYGTSNNVERLKGSVCTTEVVNKSKKPDNIDCHHIAITGLGSDSNSLNFHFDSEDEKSGMSYITRKQAKKDQQGSMNYDVVAFYFRAPDGKVSEATPASGSCRRNTSSTAKTILACKAELSGGLTLNSTLLK